MDRAAITALRRSHGYPQFLTAATVARLADEMFAVGVVLLVLDRTDSPSLAGATVAAATLPGMLSGPVIGAWLDRTGRRSLIYKIDRLLLATVLVAILAAAGHAPNFVVPLLAFVTGITLPVTMTGFTSMIPLIVEQEILPSANAVEASSLNVALIGGPALAGVIAGVAGAPTAIVVEIGLTLVALVLILRIPDLNRGASERPLPLRRLVADGLRHIAGERVLRVAAAAGAVTNIGWGILMVAFPLWAAADLGAGHSASGAIWASFAAGSLVGALALARVQARNPQEWVLFTSMLVMGAGMATWVLASSLAVALPLVALTAVVEGPAVAAVFSLRQQRTPPGLQAQVQGTLGSLGVGSFAIGSAIGGPLVVAFGPRTCIAIVATAIVAAGAIAALVRVRIRDPAVH
ncbi:MAG TPA: MFS transporter [Thermoleophilaceae bacterium]|nr:MFS transporter [Thermoleophilaceae bacterium]